MMNEILLIFELLLVYGSVLIFFKLFGLKGLYAFSVIATVLANIEVVILVNAFGMEQTLGNILFASTFLITDIVSEIIGKQEAQKVVNLNIIISIFFVIISYSWTLYNPSINDAMMPSIVQLFRAVPRVALASLVVYAIVQNIDVYLYEKWWKFTNKLSGNKDKYLYIRNNGSTLLSQMLNTVLFTLLAFYGVYEIDVMINIMIVSYVIFIFTSLLDTPVVYLARKMYKKHPQLAE